MANSVDPESDCLKSSLVWSVLFAQTCLSENLGSLRYPLVSKFAVHKSCHKAARFARISLCQHFKTQKIINSKTRECAIKVTLTNW